MQMHHEILPGAGHMMQRHQPAALARLLADFLSA
jgi:pimeloyl-ACP methyl ester carboxylesterase